VRTIYDTPSYRRIRTALQRVVRAGGVECVRCGKPIDPFEPFDVGHVDGDPTTIAGPEHRRCNRATASRRKRVVSRPW
jgi:hypothetical protein